MDDDRRIKTYVDVTADFTSSGQLMPRRIILENGVKYTIDKVTEIRRAASTRAGGSGIRYTCSICGRQCYLFYEENYRLQTCERIIQSR